MGISGESGERRSRILTVHQAIELMIGFGIFTATLIFGILTLVLNGRKK